MRQKERRGERRNEKRLRQWREIRCFPAVFLSISFLQKHHERVALNRISSIHHKDTWKNYCLARPRSIRQRTKC